MPSRDDKPFIFDTEHRLVVLTGAKARSLPELRRMLERAPKSSIFFHTHQEYLVLDFRKRVYYNDFALWVSDALREEALAEKLAAIDLLDFTAIRELQVAIVASIDDYTRTHGEVTQRCRPDAAFHFCRSRSFVLPTGLVAHDVPEFFAKLPQITHASLYFHFFEARLRLGRRTSDFSRWLRGRDRTDLADAIDALNPYVRTLDDLKRDISRIGQEAGDSS